MTNKNERKADGSDRVREVYKVTLAGSVINVALLALKFAAGILGHSAAMIADAIHPFAHRFRHRCGGVGVCEVGK